MVCKLFLTSLIGDYGVNKIQVWKQDTTELAKVEILEAHVAVPFLKSFLRTSLRSFLRTKIVHFETYVQALKKVEPN